MTIGAANLYSMMGTSRSQNPSLGGGFSPTPGSSAGTSTMQPGTSGAARALERAQSLAQQSAGISGSTSASAGGEGQSRLEQVSEDFEALFVQQMLGSMRETLNKENDLFYGGMAQDHFQDMLYKEYAKMIAKRGDFGIAEMIQSQYGK
jgi:flagellar protein FlgJ